MVPENEIPNDPNEWLNNLSGPADARLKALDRRAKELVSEGAGLYSTRQYALAGKAYRQAKSLYRKMKVIYSDTLGDYNEARGKHKEEMKLERKIRECDLRNQAKTPLHNLGYIYLSLLEFFFMYGYDYKRWTYFTILVPTLFGFLYFFSGISYNNEYNPQSCVLYFIDCFYLSGVTFMTLGFGDITVNGESFFGLAKLLSVLEAAMGWLMLSGLIIIISKKLSRP
jgi:hypothetical protein